MKPKLFAKKLSLGKITVANLDNNNMGHIKGGADTNLPHLCTDYTHCENTCTSQSNGVDGPCADTKIQCIGETTIVFPCGGIDSIVVCLF